MQRPLIIKRNTGFAPMKWLRYRFLVCMHLLFVSAFAQKQPIQFQQVENSGLSGSNVLCILQDNPGFMWFGTGDGLYKYDGYSYTVYKYNKKDPNSISNNFIPSIARSKNGDLWIATAGGGVCRYDRRKDIFIRYQKDLKDPKTLADDNVNTVLEDSKGQVWIGTTEGLDRFDPQTKKLIHYKHNENDSSSLGDNYIRNIFEDSHHDIWVATLKGGLNLFNSKDKNFIHYRHSRYDPASISSDDIYTIFEDSKNNLWIGTGEDGLSLFQRKKNSFLNFRHSNDKGNGLSNNSIRAIEESADHKLWIGTENDGINIFDPQTGSFHHYANDEHDNASPASNSINTIYKDRKGSMWIGTFNAGINLVDIDAGKFKHYRHSPSINSLSNNKVLCFYEDSKKNIWIGTDGGGLNLFDPRTNRFTSFKHEKNNKNSICGDYVLSVSEDNKGNIWIGTWGDGVSVFNPATKTFRHFKNDPYDPKTLSNNNAWYVYTDKEQNIWIGTYGGGINKFEPATNSFINYQYDEKDPNGISNNWINSMYEDSEGGFWICTSGRGLDLFDRKNKTFTHFKSEAGKNSISHNNTNSITEDSHKNLWIATLSGLNCYDRKTGKFTVYTEENGLSGDMIFGILEDERGSLWISTDRGLSCFDPLTKLFKNFTTADGLQADKFKEQAFCKSSTGVMYFGGNNGFNQFAPQNIKTIAYEPPLVITNFQLFNKEVAVAKTENDPSPLKESITETKSIELSYKNSFFSFDFASLNYSSPDKKQYAYMLEGFDEDWNEVGTQHTATYTNLDPGKYVFRVKGMNNDGQWSSAITSINVVITPPFWQTWWFRIVTALFAGSIILAIYFVRTNAIKRQKRILEQKVKEQTIQLVHAHEEEHKARLEADQANDALEEKNKELEQFVYIASHDLREPLRTTSGFADLFKQQYEGKLDDKADIYLSYITQGTNRMKRLIDDLLDYSRINSKKELEQIDCNDILNEVLADLDKVISESKAKIHTDELPVITGYRTGIKQLFQNLITNGIKFRKKDTDPVVRIVSDNSNGAWKFSFADNGIGIEQKHTEKIFAIFQRLHSQKEYEGSGIGLAHCKKIVELHKGNIWVESEPGTGSTFYFTIHKNNN